MGRRMVKIQRLESMQARQAKYSKRKKGLVKKAKELAILCDVDLALVMISPTEKPTVFVGQDKELSTVIERLVNLSLQQRQERKDYTMKMLEKLYESSESQVEPTDLSEDRSNVLKLHEEQLEELKENLARKSKILSEWKNPEDIEDLAQINIMEEHLNATLDKIRSKLQVELAMEQQSIQGGAEGLELNYNNVLQNPDFLFK